MYPKIFEIPGLGLSIYSFGFMVAVAILTAGWLTSIELKRMQAAGRVGPIRVKAKPKKKGAKDRKARRTKYEVVSPSDFVGTMTIIAAVGGIAGSKLFHILENLDQFFADPMGMIFARGGLTFYGGLIVAGLAIAYYAKQKGISRRLLADAVAPGLMIAYGIGRIGCHLAGDGDWGIQSSLADKPGWIPSWLWAETYPNNILGVTLAGDGVYPTPLYEFALCLILFGVLWMLRKHPFKAGWLMSLYLFFAGVERLLIEQIRVNRTFDLVGLQVTQAEVISVVLIVVGLVGMVLLWKRREDVKSEPSPSPVSANA